MARIFLIFIGIFSSHSAFANSCCGQSPASYSVLSLNQSLSFTTGISYLRSYGRYHSGRDGQERLEVWDRKKREVTTMNLNVASSTAERHQVFLNTNLLKGTYSDEFGKEQSSHLSDTLLGHSYELVPEYSFSYWKPVVYLTTFFNLPTGRSTYESDVTEATDVTGHGQWGFGLGVTLRKVYFPWTMTLQGRTLKLFSQTFDDVKVSDFYDSSLAFLGNYASRLWGLQFNAGITYTHLSERTIAPSQVTSEVTQNYSVLAGVQRSVSESWVAGVSYSDQTLIGPAKNSILNRSVNISLNYNIF